MNTTETRPDHYRLTHQQQRFCDEYLSHFNAFKAAINSGYSENTSRKGALLHVPKIQQYLKEAMNRRSQRLEITHDMILRELSKIAFSNMGNYYDEYACLKRMNELTIDEKAAISYYDIAEIRDGEGYRVGQQSKIKLHNKMSALDKIARHLDFYGTLGVKKQEARSRKQEAFFEEEEESAEDGLLVTTPTKAAAATCDSERTALKHDAENPSLTLPREGIFTSVVIDKSTNNLPMDYPEEDFELEGIDLKTLVALEDVNVSPGRPGLMIEGLNDGMVEGEESRMSESREVGKIREAAVAVGFDGVENTPLTPLERGNRFESDLTCGEKLENILTISPLHRSSDLAGKSYEFRARSI